MLDITNMLYIRNVHKYAIIQGSTLTLRNKFENT